MIVDGVAEANGWLEAIKQNTDASNEYLSNIAANVNASVENQAVINQSIKDGTADIVGELKETNIHAQNINESVGELTDGLSDTKISTDTPGLASLRGFSGDETGPGYKNPTNSDLPSNQGIQDAFGTLAPQDSAEDYRNQAKAALAGAGATVSGQICQLAWDIPYPSFSGVKYWHVMFDTCAYAPALNQLGTVLVFFTALSVLYSFT